MKASVFKRLSAVGHSSYRYRQLDLCVSFYFGYFRSDFTDCRSFHLPHFFQFVPKHFCRRRHVQLKLSWPAPRRTVVWKETISPQRSFHPKWKLLSLWTSRTRMLRWGNSENDFRRALFIIKREFFRLSIKLYFHILKFRRKRCCCLIESEALKSETLLLNRTSDCFELC